MRFQEAGSVYELDSLPGNSQVCVSHGMFLLEDLRGKGLANDLHKQRLAKIKSLGYNAVLCTCNKENAKQVHLLQSNGWYMSGSFQSSSTGHDVGIWMKIFI